MTTNEIRRIDLHDIITSHNPRCPARGLAEGLVAEGITEPPLALVQRLALSDNAADRAEYVRLVEQYEGQPQGLVELAESRRQKEIQPINLRAFRSAVKGTEPVQYVQRYGIISGERRVLAAAYLYAKYGEACDIGAQVDQHITVQQAYDLAVAENLQRQNMTDMEIAHVFRQYYDGGMTMRQVAEHLHQDYQFVRGRLGLTYLDEKEQQAVQTGRLGVTKAIQKGLARKAGSQDNQPVDPKAETRRRVKTLKEVEAEFDGTARNERNYLKALAWVMGLDLEVALEESEARLGEAALKAAGKAA